MSLNPELDISTALRIGLDKFIEEQMAQVGTQVYQDTRSRTSVAPRTLCLRIQPIATRRIRGFIHALA